MDYILTNTDFIGLFRIESTASVLDRNVML